MTKTIEWTLERAKQYAEERGMKFVEAKPVSKHPDDWYLAIVQVELDKYEIEPHVTYLFNSDIEGFHHGHYYSRVESAREDFLNRR